MNAVMRRPMFQPRIVRRQTGTPEGGENSNATGGTLFNRMPPGNPSALDRFFNIIGRGGNAVIDTIIPSDAPQVGRRPNVELDSYTRNLMNPEFQNFLINQVPNGQQILETLLQGNTPENFSTLIPLVNQFTAFKAKSESEEKGALPPRDDVLSEEELDFLKRLKPAPMPNEPRFFNPNLMAEGGEMKSDAVGIASGLDEETPPSDPSRDGIAKVSPEQYVQLMNEVRGDEVPLEGRVQELAMTVGEKDAKDTPLSVLALVQPVFELKEQQGIGGTQQAQNMMPPMASQQLADPQNMGIVRANTGLIVDAPFNFGNTGTTSSISNINDMTPMNFSSTPSGVNMASGAPDYMDLSNTLMSDFMSKYIKPVNIDSATLQSEINLLKDVMGDTKADAQRALAARGVDLGLQLASGADLNDVIRQGVQDFYQITKAVKDSDKAIALQAYKTLLARKTSMTDREFNLAKMGLENQLKVLFEKSKGMKNPIYLRDPKSQNILVLDGDTQQNLIADAMAKGAEPVNLSGQQYVIQNFLPKIEGKKDGGEIVKRSQGTGPEGENSVLFAAAESPGVITYDDFIKGVEQGEMGIDPSEKIGQGGMELIQDPKTVVDYQKRIVLSQELEDLLEEAISLIQNNPKLAGLVGDFTQLGQRAILPINQIFDLIGQESIVPDELTKYLSDPDIQRLATLESLIPEKLINFTKDIDSARIPALNRINQQKGDLRISGFSDATVAQNTLLSILNDVRAGANFFREGIGRPKIEYGSKLDLILQEYNLTRDDELVKKALAAIAEKPEFESQILDSLLQKLQQQSGK